MQEAADDLQGRQADIFDYMCERWAVGEFPVTTNELQDIAKCNASKVLRALRALEKKSLIYQHGQLEPLVAGGRPQFLWAPHEGSRDIGGTRGERGNTSRALHEIGGFTPKTPNHPNTLGTSTEGVLPPTSGTPVELHRNGAWSNGWVVLDASNADKVKAAKLGNSNVTVGNLRWDVDVRLCQSSPFKAESTDLTDLFDF